MGNNNTAPTNNTNELNLLAEQKKLYEEKLKLEKLKYEIQSEATKAKALKNSVRETVESEVKKALDEARKVEAEENTRKAAQDEAKKAYNQIQQPSAPPFEGNPTFWQPSHYPIESSRLINQANTSYLSNLDAHNHTHYGNDFISSSNMVSTSKDIRNQYYPLRADMPTYPNRNQSQNVNQIHISAENMLCHNMPSTSKNVSKINNSAGNTLRLNSDMPSTSKNVSEINNSAGNTSRLNPDIPSTSKNVSQNNITEGNTARLYPYNVSQINNSRGNTARLYPDMPSTSKDFSQIDNCCSNTSRLNPDMPSTSKKVSQINNSGGKLYADMHSTSKIVSLNDNSGGNTSLETESNNNDVQIMPPQDDHVKSTKARQRFRNKNKNNVFCQICNIKIEVKIFFCENQHTLCEQCSKVATQCNLCRRYSSHKKETKEYHASEQRAPCPNAKFGCKIFSNPINMDHHLKNCIFSDILCPLNELQPQACDWKGKTMNLMKHFGQFHEEHLRADVATELVITQEDLDGGSQILHLIRMGPNKFVVNIKSDTFLYMTVRLFATERIASNWTYEFHMYNESLKYYRTDVCNSAFNKLDYVYNNLYCVKLPLNYVRNFIDEDGALKYKFYIKNQRYFTNDEN